MNLWLFFQVVLHSPGHDDIDQMHVHNKRGREWPYKAGSFPYRYILLLGIAAAQAADRPHTLRAGTGVRQQDIRLQHLTQKAVCTKTFLGQTPLFKGEWVPHTVSCHALKHPPRALTYRSFLPSLRHSAVINHVMPTPQYAHVQVECCRAGPQLPGLLLPGQRLPKLGRWVQLPEGRHREQGQAAQGVQRGGLSPHLGLHMLHRLSGSSPRLLHPLNGICKQDLCQLNVPCRAEDALVAAGVQAVCV